MLQEGEVMAAGGASDHRRVGQTLLGIQMNEYFEGGLTVFPMSRFGVFSLLSVASQGSEGLGLEPVTSAEERIPGPVRRPGEIRILKGDYGYP